MEFEVSVMIQYFTFTLTWGFHHDLYCYVPSHHSSLLFNLQQQTSSSEISQGESCVVINIAPSNQYLLSMRLLSTDLFIFYCVY